MLVYVYHKVNFHAHVFRCKEHGNFLATKLMASFVEISMYLAAKFMARYFHVPCNETHRKRKKNELKIEWKFPPTIFSHS